jgi:hypothetical protein
MTGLEVLKNETYAKAMWAEWKDMIDEASKGLPEDQKEKDEL